MEDDLNTIAVVSNEQETFKMKFKNGNKFLLKMSAIYFKNNDVIEMLSGDNKLHFKVIDKWYNKIFRFFRIQKYRKMVEI